MASRVASPPVRRGGHRGWRRRALASDQTAVARGRGGAAPSCRPSEVVPATRRAAHWGVSVEPAPSQEATTMAEARDLGRQARSRADRTGRDGGDPLVTDHDLRCPIAMKVLLKEASEEDDVGSASREDPPAAPRSHAGAPRSESQPCRVLDDGTQNVVARSMVGRRSNADSNPRQIPARRPAGPGNAPQGRRSRSAGPPGGG